MLLPAADWVNTEASVGVGYLEYVEVAFNANIGTLHRKEITAKQSFSEFGAAPQPG